MVRVAAALARPPSSITLREATKLPGVEYVTAPGLAIVLDAGLPPANDQAYPLTTPSTSAPLPANDTDSPGLIVMFPTGAVIVATGAWLGTGDASFTKVAIDGTP